MTDDHDELGELLEELCKTQITEQEVEARIVSLVREKDVSTINNMPPLHRLQIKRLLKERGEQTFADKIKE